MTCSPCLFHERLPPTLAHPALSALTRSLVLTRSRAAAPPPHSLARTLSNHSFRFHKDSESLKLGSKAIMSIWQTRLSFHWREVVAVNRGAGRSQHSGAAGGPAGHRSESQGCELCVPQRAGSCAGSCLSDSVNHTPPGGHSPEMAVPTLEGDSQSVSQSFTQLAMSWKC